MIKNLFLLILILSFCSCIKAQKVDVEILDSKIIFSNKNPVYSPVSLNYSIKNTSADQICFVLDKNSFGIFGIPNDYYFNYSENNKLYPEEKIFNPRLLVFESEMSSDAIEISGSTNCYIVEELDRLKVLQDKADEDSLKILKVYQNDYFKEKPLSWVVRAKYINYNIVFLKPFETIKISSKIDFRFYHYNEIDKNKAGYYLQNKNYKMQINLYSNPTIISEYLSDTNRKKVEELSAKFVDGVSVSNKTNLVVTE